MTTLPRVCALVTPTFNGDLDKVDPAIKKEFEGKVQLLTLEESLASAETNPVDGVLAVVHPHVDGELIDRLAPNGSLKVVSNYGVGVEHINLKECADRGIPVGNTPNVLTNACADLALALMLASARNITEADEYARSDRYTSYDNMVLLGAPVAGRCVGIVGMGRIGGEVAKRCSKGFGMNVLYFNRNRKTAEEEQELNATYCPLDELVQRADFVVLCCPLSQETHHLINERTLALMQPHTRVINVARGPVVDSDALAAAIQTKKIGGAGLDVTEPEPLPLDHPLRKMKNVIMTPHRASATSESRAGMVDLCVSNLMKGLAGEPLEAQCN